MNLSYADIPAGNAIPDDFFTVIEIPANHSPIKYEVDKPSGQIFVDRFLSTPMFYPANYGFIPKSPGVVIRSRPVGVMYMTDEAGADAKVIAVPHEKLSSMYSDVKECSDLPSLLLAQIQHFFEKPWQAVKSQSHGEP
jgi:inorganic pyrophosphatase